MQEVISAASHFIDPIFLCSRIISDNRILIATLLILLISCRIPQRCLILSNLTEAKNVTNVFLVAQSKLITYIVTLTNRSSVGENSIFVKIIQFTTSFMVLIVDQLIYRIIVSKFSKIFGTCILLSCDSYSLKNHNPQGTERNYKVDFLVRIASGETVIEISVNSIFMKPLFRLLSFAFEYSLLLRCCVVVPLLFLIVSDLA